MQKTKSKKFPDSLQDNPKQSLLGVKAKKLPTYKGMNTSKKKKKLPDMLSVSTKKITKMPTSAY